MKSSVQPVQPFSLFSLLSYLENIYSLPYIVTAFVSMFNFCLVLELLESKLDILRGKNKAAKFF